MNVLAFVIAVAYVTDGQGDLRLYTGSDYAPLSEDDQVLQQTLMTIGRNPTIVSTFIPPGWLRYNWGL